MSVEKTYVAGCAAPSLSSVVAVCVRALGSFDDGSEWTLRREEPVPDHVREHEEQRSEAACAADAAV